MQLLDLNMVPLDDASVSGRSNSTQSWTFLVCSASAPKGEVPNIFLTRLIIISLC